MYACVNFKYSVRLFDRYAYTLILLDYLIDTCIHYFC